MSTASFLKNLEGPLFYLFKLELTCYFLSLSVVFLNEFLLALLTLLAFRLVRSPELKNPEFFILLSLDYKVLLLLYLLLSFTSREDEPWLGFTIMTDLFAFMLEWLLELFAVTVLLLFSLFLELRWSLLAKAPLLWLLATTWWLSMIQLLCTILLFKMLWCYVLFNWWELWCDDEIVLLSLQLFTYCGRYCS